MEVFIPNFYIYSKRNILFECIPINFDFTVLSQFKNLCPKSHKIVSFLSKRFITKIDTGKQNQCSTFPAVWNLEINRRFPQTDRLEIQCMCQSRYIALRCKISLLSRQRTTKALIRLRGCAGWSVPLLFTYDKNRFSHDVAHLQINRSYLCRIRRKRVCCIQFYGEKKQLLIYNSGDHFCRGFIENKFAPSPSICVRNGTMRLIFFVWEKGKTMDFSENYCSLWRQSW